MSKAIPRIAFVSAMSGGGKTTAACAVMRAFVNKGLSVSPFKCGPDYIDPMHHFAAAGRQGVNLDPFFLSPAELREVFCENAKDADIAVIEGVMGYYDGVKPDSDKASTYDTLKTLGVPAVLVIPARGMSYTIISVINGIVGFRNDSNIKAVILSGVTEMTYKMLKPVIERETGTAAVGYIPRLENTVESRHLGLTMPWENDADVIEKNAEMIAETVDLGLILKLAESAPSIDAEKSEFPYRGHVKIGVAYDRAFCFYYKDNLDILKSMGAEPVYFSPIEDENVPDGVSGLIFGGGYPELHSEALSKNTPMLKSVRGCIESGMPCIAECGGFMYLHERIEVKKGCFADMAGVIKADAVKRDRLVRFGYAELSAIRSCVYLGRGETVRIHEFHYWDSTDNGSGCIAVKPGGRRSWECVHTEGTLFAGFPHIYLRSEPRFAERFIDECMRYGK